MQIFSSQVLFLLGFAIIILTIIYALVRLWKLPRGTCANINACMLSHVTHRTTSTDGTTVSLSNEYATFDIKKFPL